MITNKLFLIMCTNVYKLFALQNKRFFFITALPIFLILFDMTNSNDCTNLYLSNVSFILCSSNLPVLYKEQNNLPLLYNQVNNWSVSFKELLNKAKKSANSKSEDTNNNDEDKLDPNYVNGITDGEGNFYISIYKDKRWNNKEQIRFYYKVTQRDYSIKMLNKLQKFFNCGSVVIENKNLKTMRFVINNLKHIELIVIPHFEKYPLLSSKRLNFDDFKKAFTLFKIGAHKSAEGLDEIKKLQKGMNKGRSFADKFNSLNNKDIKIHPAWIQGFVDGEGCFNANIRLKVIAENRLEVVIQTLLSIGQNIHDVALLEAIRKFFNNGVLSPKISDITNLENVKSKADEISEENTVGLVTYVNSNLDSFIPLFEKYTLFTEKQKDFLDFKKFCELRKSRANLTRKGLEEMIKIAWQMNSGRFGISRRKELIKPDWNKITKIVTV